MKRCKAANTQIINFNETTQTKLDAPPPPPPAPERRPDTKTTVISDANTLKPECTPSDENGLTLKMGTTSENIGFNIGNQKQQKNKKGGYSKQQFVDELE